MPQPLKSGSWISGPDALMKRPMLAAYIGNVVANWQTVERELLSLYALLMGDYVNPSKFTETGEPFQPPTHPLAYQIFDQFNTLQLRLNLVASLCQWRVTPERYEYFDQKLKPEIRKRAKERNAIVHGQWGLSDDHEDGLILMQIYGHPQIWKESDFLAVSQRINATRHLLGQFNHEEYRMRCDP